MFSRQSIMFCGVDIVCAVFAYCSLARRRAAARLVRSATSAWLGDTSGVQANRLVMEAPPRHADPFSEAHTSPVGCSLLAPEMSAAAHVRYVGSCTKGHRIRNNSRLDLIISVVINRLERPLRRLKPPRLRLCYILAVFLVALQSSFVCCYYFPAVHHFLVLVQHFVFCDYNCKLKHDA